ncbi:ABC transporter substrate-binding protein [Thioalkalivibrio sp. ARh3]|uniref:ABC transporter substrate-binding protein n=1 Tax=Thioalkalivibrio sp. ARh3 TaxID=1158148 RepID=UPI000374AC93|nr:ABC transporter substrate-binding protein [Thioalkalivibrio sp. ARh3]
MIISEAAIATRRPPPNASPRWRGLLAAIAVLLPLLLAGCAGSEEPPLRVATIPWIGYQPLHLAADRGEFRTEDIRLARFASNVESLRAIRNGNVDVAALTLDEALLLRADGHDIRVILLLDYSHGGDTILAQPGITRITDLKDRRVGVENDAATAYLLARGLEYGGLDREAIQIVRVDAGRHAEAFRDQEIDALATFEPIRTRLLKDGAEELFDSTKIPGEIVDVLVARRAALDEHPGHLRKLVNGWFSALNHLDAEPGPARTRMAANSDLSEDELETALSGVRFPSRTENCEALARSGESLRSTTQRLADLMLGQGLLERQVDLDRLFDDRVLQASGCPETAGG